MYQVEPMTREETDRTLNECVCSNCWGALTFKWNREGNNYFVICPSCDTETKGYVSKKFAERKRAESLGEYLEAGRNLRGVLGARPKQSRAANLKQIGF